MVAYTIYIRVRQAKYVAQADKDEILISDFSIEIDNIPIKGGKFNYEEELNKFLTNNSLDRITPIADINICFSLVENVKVKEEKLKKLKIY